MRFATVFVWVFVAGLGLRATAGCGDSFSGGQCRNISGTWSISGDCPPSSCTFDQDGCRISAHSDGGLTASGTVNETSLTFSASGAQCKAAVDFGMGGSSPTASGTC